MRYCSECKKEKKEKYCDFCKKNTGSRFVMECFTAKFTICILLMAMIHRRPGFKKFLRKVLTGFQASGDKIKHPEGVIRRMIIDRENDQYEEVVVDYKTNEITRNVKEPLSQYVPNAQKRDK